MTKTNINVTNEKLTLATTGVIGVDKNKAPKLLSKKQWAIENERRLPEFWTEDYPFMVNMHYQEYLLSNQFVVEQYQQYILITDAKTKKNTFLSQILVTLQTTPIKHDIQLILRTKEGEEVSLCSLKDVDIPFDPSQYFVNQQVDFAKVLNQRISSFCLPVSQQLYLRLKGGVLLKESVLVCSKYE
ncbi:hypothetical protein [Colwellia sp. C1TZA3]|uniref:hypothetical protein n=1 Tax=Colwellia sp. C1TZA3 TaxID=2508879 RepID=UPI0011BA28C9|nr:hypothetical protein [Colwellia sp. C1TZA3]TWX70428.1 hypothetical protein ESZ39_10065 [Colwellia sp. C1TZA3]